MREECHRAGRQAGSTDGNKQVLGRGGGEEGVGARREECHRLRRAAHRDSRDSSMGFGRGGCRGGKVGCECRLPTPTAPWPSAHCGGLITTPPLLPYTQPPTQHTHRAPVLQKVPRSGARPQAGYLRHVPPALGRLPLELSTTAAGQAVHTARQAAADNHHQQQQPGGPRCGPRSPAAAVCWRWFFHAGCCCGLLHHPGSGATWD